MSQRAKLQSAVDTAANAINEAAIAILADEDGSIDSNSLAYFAGHIDVVREGLRRTISAINRC